MKILNTKLIDAKIIEMDFIYDNRGFFVESYSKKKFEKNGLFFDFLQDNYSFSKSANVLRGLHFQKNKSVQTKLINVISGSIFDVIVDIRKNSPTYGKWEGFFLSQYNCRQLLVPRGFAHGFITLTDNVQVLYKCDNYYNSKLDSGIIFNDVFLKINWLVNKNKIILSFKDKKLKTFKEIDKENLFFYK